MSSSARKKAVRLSAEGVSRNSAVPTSGNLTGETERIAAPSTIRRSAWKRIRKRYKKFQLSLSPQQNIVYGFLNYSIIGWLLLSLPFFHKQPVSLLDNLFITVSAISTTGLVTVSVFDTYNWFGQFIVMLLFQIGGIGYMTFTSFIIHSSRKLTHWHHRILSAEFTLPRGFEIIDFLRSVIVFTFTIEAIGTVCFFFAFREEGVETTFALWSSIFHSVSAFCTAGFGLYNNSFESFAGNTSINVIIAVLSTCGSLGFIVVTDLWNRARGKTSKISFTSKVIFFTFLVLLLAGALVIFLFEPSLADLDPYERLLISFFQSGTALTTVGFNTYPIGKLAVPILLFITFQMYVGASPSGTGGGFKSTTLIALIAIMWSRIRGSNRVAFLGHTIPLDRLYLATSTFIFYTAMLFFGTFLLTFTEAADLPAILFEAASAIGTVGLSTGLTATLTSWGKVILILMMFIGRLGVITFGMAMLARTSKADASKTIDDLAV